MPIIEKISLRQWQSKRILGLDYGDKRIGVAISDETHLLSFPLAVLASHRVFDELFRIVDKNNVGLTVVGLPLSIDGGETQQLVKVRKFVDKLLSLRDIDITFFDERLSTVESMQHVNEARLSRTKQKKIRDKVAASIILQSFLDSRDR